MRLAERERRLRLSLPLVAFIKQRQCIHPVGESDPRSSKARDKRCELVLPLVDRRLC